MASQQNNALLLRPVTLRHRRSGSAEVLTLPPTPSLAAPYTTTASRTTGTTSFAGVIQAAGARPVVPPPSPTASIQPLPLHETVELNTQTIERSQFNFSEASGQRDSSHGTFDTLDRDLFSELIDVNAYNALVDDVATFTQPEGPSHQGPELNGPAPPPNLDQDCGASPTLDLAALLVTSNALPTNAQNLIDSLHSTYLLGETQLASHVTPTRPTNNIQAAPSHYLSIDAANTVQDSGLTYGNASNILEPHVRVSNVIQPPFNLPNILQSPPNHFNTSQSFGPGESSHIDHAESLQCYLQPPPSANHSNHDFSNVEGEMIHVNASNIPPINTSSQLLCDESALVQEMINMGPVDLINAFSNLSENLDGFVEDISRSDTTASLHTSSHVNSDASFLAAAPEPHTSFEYGSFLPSVPQTSDSKDNAGCGSTVQQGRSDGTCFLGEGPSQIASAGLQLMYPSSATQSQGRQQVVPLQNEPQQMVFTENVQQHNAQNLILTPMPFVPDAATPPLALTSNAQLSTGRFILQNGHFPDYQNSNDFAIVGPQLHSQSQNDRQQASKYVDVGTLHHRQPTSEYSRLQNTPLQLPLQSPVFTPILNLPTPSGLPVVVSVPEKHHPALGANRRQGTDVMGPRASDQQQGLVVQRQGSAVQQQGAGVQLQELAVQQQGAGVQQQGLIVHQQGPAVQQQQPVSLSQSPTATQRWQETTQQRVTMPQPASQTQAGRNMQSRFVQQQRQLHRIIIPHQTVQSSSQQSHNLSQQQQRTYRLPHLALPHQSSQIYQQHQQIRCSQQQPSQLKQQQQEHQQFIRPTMSVRRVPGYNDPDQGGIITKTVVMRKKSTMGALPAKTSKINTNVKDSNFRLSVKKLFTDGKRFFIATPRSEPYPVAAETSALDHALSLHGSVSAPNLTSQLTTDPSNSSTFLALSSVELRDLLASIELPSNESQSASNRVHLQSRAESNVPRAVQEHANEVSAAVRQPTIELQPSTSTGFTGTDNSHWSVWPPESSEEDELNDADDDDVLQSSFNGSSEESCSGSGGKIEGSKGKGIGPMRRSRGRRSLRASASSAKAVRLSSAEQKRIDAEKYRKNVEANNMASKKCREKRKEKEREIEEVVRILSLRVPERREYLQRQERYRDIFQEFFKLRQKKPPKDED